MKKLIKYRTIKRFYDIGVSILLLVLGSPLILIITLLIILDSGLPVFFIQERVGLNKRIINIYKFRTMKVGSEELLNKEYNSPTDKGKLITTQITRVGYFLRKYSLDELPQLINVLTGELSLIGPRCLAIKDALLFSPWGDDRFLIKPGITGIWQISNRRWSCTIEEIYCLDKYYIDHCSLWLDIQITLKTIKVVLLGRNK
jgi:lipopolysaccharide/colanic/teichoic acid biosynthesis glycosyltransferase